MTICESLPFGHIPLPSLAALQALAARISPYLRVGDVVTLRGDLGAGKTEFARSLLRVLGVEGDVPSPTFTLVQSYEVRGLRIAHYDLYRLKSNHEVEELGWDDALAEGVTLVEWSERAAEYMPADRLDIAFTCAPDVPRSCVIEKHGNWKNR